MMYFGYGGGSEFTANNAMDRYCPKCEYAWKGSEHECMFCHKPGIVKPSGGPVIVSAMTIRQDNYSEEA
jgi:hypothetical protein